MNNHLLAQAIPRIFNPAISNKVGMGSGVDILQLFLTNGINLLLGASGIVAFVMLLWGGIGYITAGGDKEGTQNSIKRITAALIGLVIILLLFAIINIVEKVFGITITKFDIPVIL